MREFFDYKKEFEIKPMRGVDPLRFKFDVSKAERLLGFKADFNFMSGLKAWFKKND
ncbi:MAG: NAD(P)-dependent oxidoreductase [Elusimicrobia bacterium]|nr:NAD(P)-dependent oxidoreductase [Elusimicrobiota bacterium]